MAISLPALIQRIQIDASGAKQGASEVESAGKKIGGSFGSIHKTVGLLGGAIAGLAIGEFFKNSIEEARKSERSQRLIAQAIQHTGDVSHTSAKGIEDQASKLSVLDGVSKLNILSSDQLLLRFTNIRNEQGKNNDIFNRATAIIQDVTAATGKGLTPVTIALGKALNDPVKGVTALTRIGIQFTEQQKAQIQTLVKSNNTLGAQKLILDAIQSRFGGAAAAAADPMQRLHALVQNLEESVGTALIPMLNGLITAVTPIVSVGVQLINVFERLPGPIKTTALALALLSAFGKLGLVTSAATGLFNVVAAGAAKVGLLTAAEETNAAATGTMGAAYTSTATTMAATTAATSEAEAGTVGLVGSMGALTGALAVAVGGAVIWNKILGDDGSKAAAKLAAGIEAGGESATAARAQIAKLSQEQKTADDIMKKHGGAIPDQFRAVVLTGRQAGEELKKVQKDYEKWKDSLTAGQAVTVAAQTAQQAYADAVAKYGVNSRQATAARADYIVALRSEKVVDDAVATAQTAVSSGLGTQAQQAAQAAEALKSLDAQVKALKDEYDLLFGRNVDLQQSNLDVQKAFGDVQKQIAAVNAATLAYIKAAHEHGKASQAARDAEAALNDALNSSESSALSYIGTLEKQREAQVRASGSTNTANAAFAFQAAALLRTQEQAGATTGQLMIYLRALGLTPKQVATVLSMPGGKQVSALIAIIEKKLPVLKQPVRIPISLDDSFAQTHLFWWSQHLAQLKQAGVFLTVAQGTPASAPHQHGAFITAPQTVSVGEHFLPEVILPLTNMADMVRVIKQSSSADVLGRAVVAAKGLQSSRVIAVPSLTAPSHAAQATAAAGLAPVAPVMFTGNIYTERLDEAWVKRQQRKTALLQKRAART